MYSNYVFRFPSQKLNHVYYPSYQKHTYFSVPLISKSQENRNVLTFYKHKHLIPDNHKNNIKKCDLEEVKYLTSILKMPAMVVMNQYCDLSLQDEITELYFMNQQVYKDFTSCQ